MFADYTKPPINVTGLNGLWQRGAAETCPQDHLQYCNNCTFPGKNQVTIRESATYSSIITGRTIISYAIATVASSPRLLTLNSNGKFYDETAVTLLGTFSGADDFVCLSVFGRAYISFKYQGKALTGTVIWYYDGTNFYQAGCAAPTTSVTLAQVNTGVVDAGVHGVAISYQTATGHLSPPNTVTTITSTGSNDIEVSGIPISSDPRVTGRVVFMTMANQTELYFVPNGTIGNNTATTFTINNHDSALVTSADYLNDVLTTLPACSSLRLYNGRLVLLGKLTSPDQVLVSNQLDPETINNVTGVVNLPVDYGVNTTNTAVIIRGVLYVMKPNGTYAVQDNGGDPGTWPVTPIDTGLGAYDNGISLFSSAFSGQDILDQCLVLTKRGLLIFNGSYSDPPLTYKIDGFWQQIQNYDSSFNSVPWYRAQLAHDINMKRIYIFTPYIAVGGGTSYLGYQILMGDYTEGLGPTTIKWSTWDFNGFTATSAITKISVENFTAAYGVYSVYNLTFCNGTASIYKTQVPASSAVSPLYGDLPSAGSPEPSYPIRQGVQTANLAFGPGINLYTMLGLAINGLGSLAIELYSKRGEVQTGILGFNLTAYQQGFGTSQFVQQAGSDLYRGINFQSEQMSILLETNNVFTQSPYTYQLTSFFTLTGIQVYGKVMYKLRSVLVQPS